MSKITTEIYLERARKIHGDTYDYSKTVYKSALEKITITCKIHGDFTLRTRNHVDNKQGCKKCSRLISAAKTTKNTGYFIEKAKEVHGDKFDYSKSEYTKNKEKIVVTCRLHGDFKVLPNNHLIGFGGCSACKIEAVTQRITKTYNEFISEAEIIHKGFYDYTETKYLRSNKEVDIHCRIHGGFSITPSSHLKGYGCHSCGKIRTANAVRKSQEDFIKDCLRVHGNVFFYDKVIYSGSFNKVIITCKIHGDFRIAPSNFLNGSGCSRCSLLDRGYSRSDFVSRCKRKNNGVGNIYIIKCYNDSEVFYKVGISSTNIEGRYDSNKKMPYKYELVEEYSTEPEKAYDAENHVLKEMVGYSYQPSIQFKGKTECFSTLEPISDCLRQYLNVK